MRKFRDKQEENRKKAERRHELEKPRQLSNYNGELHQNDNDDDDEWMKEKVKNLTLMKRGLVEAIVAETKQKKGEVIKVWNGIAAV
eukprot:908325-Heterocapsa_arctica.AAC.1